MTGSEGTSDYINRVIRRQRELELRRGKGERDPTLLETPEYMRKVGQYWTIIRERQGLTHEQVTQKIGKFARNYGVQCDANPEDHLGIEPDPRWVNPLSYARYGGTLAVYRGDRLKKWGYTTYEFIDLETKSETLVAVSSLRSEAD